MTYIWSNACFFYIWASIKLTSCFIQCQLNIANVRGSETKLPSLGGMGVCIIGHSSWTLNQSPPLDVFPKIKDKIWKIKEENWRRKIVQLGYPERCHNHCLNFNCFRLNLIGIFGECIPLTRIFRSSSTWKKLRFSSINKNVEVVLHYK